MREKKEERRKGDKYMGVQCRGRESGIAGQRRGGRLMFRKVKESDEKDAK